MQLTSHSMHRYFDLVADLPAFFHRLIVAFTQAFHGSRFVVHASGKLRRIWLAHFRKGYVERQLSIRQGACRQCGTCCNLLFPCPMLTEQALCRIYDTCRDKVCKVFPIDQRDIHEVELYGGHCGYSFEKQGTDL